MHTRSHTLCAALTEICCPQIARASVMNASPRRIMNTLGWRFMMAAITGSLRASARLARSQYSGFMQGKAGEKILRLHLHYAVLAREREVHGAALDVGAHGGGIVELQREDREDVAHAALLDLGARPQLVQDGGRLRVEPHVPRPARLVDLAHRLHLDPGAENMKNPRLEDAAQRSARQPAVGQADHRVVARVPLPVPGSVAAV